jgi:hypothetical protein
MTDLESVPSMVDRFPLRDGANHRASALSYADAMSGVSCAQSVALLLDTSVSLLECEIA